MIKTIFIFVVGFLSVFQGYAQTDSLNKRPPFELKLFVDDSKSFSLPVGETKYISNDTILNIFPGEKLFLEATITNNRVTNFRVVNEIKDASKTLTIDFQQKAKGKVHQFMTLTVTNPFDKKLHYKAMMNLLRNNKWVNTNVYPVLPNIKGIEMWTDPIAILALGSFELND